MMAEDLMFEGIPNKYVPFMNCEIRPERRSGNTTRCVDTAIQTLFNEGKVLLVDHFEKGSHKRANWDMQNKVLDRLKLMNLPIVQIGAVDKPLNQPYVEASGFRNSFNGSWIKLVNNFYL